MPNFSKCLIFVNSDNDIQPPWPEELHYGVSCAETNTFDVNRAEHVDAARSEVAKNACLAIRILKVGKAQRDFKRINRDLQWMGWNILCWHVHSFSPEEAVGEHFVAPILGACGDDPNDACQPHTKFDPAIEHLGPEISGFRIEQWLAQNNYVLQPGTSRQWSSDVRKLVTSGIAQLKENQRNQLVQQSLIYADGDSLTGSTDSAKGDFDRVFYVHTVENDDGDGGPDSDAEIETTIAEFLASDRASPGRYVIVRCDPDRTYAKVESYHCTPIEDEMITVRRGTVLIGSDGEYFSFWIFDKASGDTQRYENVRSFFSGLLRQIAYNSSQDSEHAQ